MAKFRQVYTEFWKDPKVIEEMTPEDKFFMLYLLTNESTTQIGVYQITKKQMAFEMGHSIETINSLIQRFENIHKNIKYNTKTREIAIKNWGKYNFFKGGKPVYDLMKSEMENVKDVSLLGYVLENYLKTPKVNSNIVNVFEVFFKEHNIPYESYIDTCCVSCDDTLTGRITIGGQEVEEEVEEDIDKEKDKEKDKSKDNSVEDSFESPSDDKLPSKEIRYPKDSMYYQAALYLRGKILEFNPRCKVPKDNPKNLEKWSNDMRLMFERDERSREEMAAMIKFVFDTDDFWRTVVQSPSGLRKNWDKIAAQMIVRNKHPDKKQSGSFQEQIDKMKDW
ncbi:hypothetical protein [Crassaminicella profunda]|uniref:hypothetical protein n=1 Tax=Crassaminicella profunda TaxID=1286698 RepID=UPI001CA62FA1|nr:hypothetical protein [Crassaminicella profunda]QZY56684.1 hypothetical protein K7H06_07120 [Crassaminicella profunda]